MQLPATLTLDTGQTITLAGFDGFIQHVRLPWGQRIESTLKRDEAVLLTSILVVPPEGGAPKPPAELGMLRFGYSGRTPFSAPVLGLMDRYHGLTTLSGLLGRFRLLIDPTASARDLLQDGLPAPMKPVHMVEHLMCTLEHEADITPDAGPYRGALPRQDVFVVELQGLVKCRDRDYLDKRPVLFGGASNPAG